MTIPDIIAQSKSQGCDPRFTTWLLFVMNWECVFGHDRKTIVCENVAGDSGGRTFAGIDESSHPHFPFDNPTPEDVVNTYLADVFGKIPWDKLLFPAAEVVSNFAVNLGLGAAVKLLQKAIDSFQVAAPAGGGEAVAVDGGLGEQTIEVAESLDPDALAQAVDDEADAKYRALGENPRMKKFMDGWLNRDASLDQWWMKLEQQEMQG